MSSRKRNILKRKEEQYTFIFSIVGCITGIIGCIAGIAGCVISWKSIKYANPNIQVEYAKNWYVNSHDIDSYIFGNDGKYYIALPVRISNISDYDSELLNINLRIDNVKNSYEESIMCKYTTDYNNSNSLITTYELEMELDVVQLPLKINSMEAVEGYIVFQCESFVNSETDFTSSIASLIYSTPYNDRVEKNNILGRLDEDDFNFYNPIK